MTKSENIGHRSPQNDKLRQKKWIKTEFSFFVNILDKNCKNDEI